MLPEVSVIITLPPAFSAISTLCFSAIIAHPLTNFWHYFSPLFDYLLFKIMRKKKISLIFHYFSLFFTIFIVFFQAFCACNPYFPL